MAEFDRVDHMMQQAGQPARKRTTEPDPDAEAVLEDRVTTAERGVPRAAAPADPATPVAEPVAALGAAHVSPAERGRQILGALRPFLPVVGGALRMVDHGAAQAVARMLPALSVMGAARTAEAPPAETRTMAIAAFETQQAELRRELNDCQQEITAHDEKLRRLRESLERAVAEQGTLSLKLNQLGDRTRLLTAAVVILLMIAIAESVLLVMVFRR